MFVASFVGLQGNIPVANQLGLLPRVRRPNATGHSRRPRAHPSARRL